MPLIEDIAPPGGRRDRALKAASQSARRVHRATQLSRLPRDFDLLRQQVVERPHRRAPLLPTQPAKPLVGVKPSRWRRLGEFAQYPLIAGLAIGAAYDATFGQAVIGIYLLIAVIFKIDSRYSFGAALLLLVSIPGFQLINLTGVSERAAIYCYEMLVVGTLQAIIELARDRHTAVEHKH